jgi:hypothetical protein
MLRQLKLEDMDAAARVVRTAFDQALPSLAGLHTPEEDQWFFRERVFASAQGQPSGEERQRVFDVGDGIADQPEGMQYFSKCKADESGPGGNDQAKSDRVGVDGASPAAARGRTRPDIVPDRPERDQAQNPEYGCDIGRRHGEAQIILRFQHKLIKKFC